MPQDQPDLRDLHDQLDPPDQLDLPHDNSQKVIVALDLSAKQALQVAQALQGAATWMKVGLTLLYETGPSIIRQLKDMGFMVFADTKLNDIPHQIRGAAASLTAAGADMFTVHANGGTEMMRQARLAVQTTADSQKIPRPKLLAITVLTSIDQVMLAEQGVAVSLPEQVSNLAGLAIDAGMDGVVASPLEIQMLREQLGAEPLIVTPGIRSPGADNADQSRVASAAEAFAAGADLIVVGRPITAATDPLQAFHAILE
ncbi:MAG: orotidine-5'-phosphate decarboxylase [Coriobacteriales bacterium]|jgi:orotidine-5'-phosphate decarboxylase|nr:orotidine-5'-phosphate decarboxylase [Coriobacteriales bacterium]